MLNIKIRVQLAIVIYLIIIGVFIYINPSYIYDEDGNLKKFGTGNIKTDTICPLWLIILIFAVVSYYSSNLIILLVNKEY